jgi:hypothetical protein
MAFALSKLRISKSAPGFMPVIVQWPYCLWTRTADADLHLQTCTCKNAREQPRAHSNDQRRMLSRSISAL